MKLCFSRLLSLPARTIFFAFKYKGLSWTRNEEVAEWFAKRYLKVGQCGYVFSGELAREDIIAQYSGRKESEVVCDWKKVQNIQCKTVLKTGDKIYKFRK